MLPRMTSQLLKRSENNNATARIGRRWRVLPIPVYRSLLWNCAKLAHIIDCRTIATYNNR